MDMLIYVNGHTEYVRIESVKEIIRAFQNNLCLLFV